MNEDRKKRGLAHSKFLTVVAMSALFLSSGNVMATQVASDNVLEVTEQLQSINVTGLVIDATGEPIIGASVVEKGTTNGIVTDIDGKFILSVKTGAMIPQMPNAWSVIYKHPIQYRYRIKSVHKPLIEHIIF